MARLPKLFREAFEKFPNIISNRQIMSGAPCVASRRIPVWVIAGRFAAGESINDIAADYELKRTEVVYALRFTCWTSKLGQIKFWKFEASDRQGARR